MRRDRARCAGAGVLSTTRAFVAHARSQLTLWLRSQLSQYDNLLEGTVPADVWEGLNVLTELTYFALSTNFLYGQPGLTSFGSTFTKNEYFDLNYNHLDGPVPAVGAQTKLTHLILANNNFNGSVAEVLAPLSQLNYLDIHSNWLSGSIPDSLCREANLTYCSLVSPKHKQNVFSDVPGCITSSTKCILG